MKCEYLRGNGRGSNIVFATGTPVTNTMAELYNMQRYLSPNLLDARGSRTSARGPRPSARSPRPWSPSPRAAAWTSNAASPGSEPPRAHELVPLLQRHHDRRRPRPRPPRAREPRGCGPSDARTARRGRGAGGARREGPRRLRPKAWTTCSRSPATAGRSRSTRSCSTSRKTPTWSRFPAARSTVRAQHPRHPQAHQGPSAGAQLVFGTPPRPPPGAGTSGRRAPPPHRGRRPRVRDRLRDRRQGQVEAEGRRCTRRCAAAISASFWARPRRSAPGRTCRRASPRSTTSTARGDRPTSSSDWGVSCARKAASTTSTTSATSRPARSTATCTPSSSASSASSARSSRTSRPCAPWTTWTRSLSLAQMKQIAEGDPTVAERMDVENKIGQLKLMMASHLEGLADVQHKIETQYRPLVEALTSQRDMLADDEIPFAEADLVRQQTLGSKDSSLTVGGTHIADKGGGHPRAAPRRLRRPTRLRGDHRNLPRPFGRVCRRQRVLDDDWLPYIGLAVDAAKHVHMSDRVFPFRRERSIHRAYPDGPHHRPGREGPRRDRAEAARSAARARRRAEGRQGAVPQQAELDEAEHASPSSSRSASRRRRSASAKAGAARRGRGRRDRGGASKMSARPRRASLRGRGRRRGPRGRPRGGAPPPRAHLRGLRHA